MDAVDCALVDCSAGTPRVIDFLCKGIGADLKTRLLELSSNQQLDLRLLGSTDIEVAHLFADAVHALLDKNKLTASSVQAIGSHGQTIWHEPPQSASRYPFTLQIGDPNTLAELTGITVVADFRRKDMAAGGQGAPLVPALHRELFQHAGQDRIILNLGGIANITLLPGAKGTQLGLDTGPASVLMDGWIKQQRNLDYDDEGKWAQSGEVNQQLLAALLDEAYFQLPAPKSTGREFLNLTWLQRKLAGVSPLPPPEDVQATLLELTAVTVSREIQKLLQRGEIIACGGGARNSALLRRLQQKLPAFTLRTSTELGIHADCVEAVAFAWLAKKTLHREAVDFGPFTGARHPVISGGVYFCEK
jgi:anhydro-N-acetylmuramic acid kinase